jgi:hypothetical protein
MSVSTLAKYTLVNDGQTRWYADTADLVAGLVAAGYTYERYQGYDAVAEPAQDTDDDGPDGRDAYSILCSLVSAVDREVVMADPEAEVETLEYQPGTVGERRLRVSRDLGEAVYAATPE